MEFAHEFRVETIAKYIYIGREIRDCRWKLNT
jgi:hypothetical protein